MTWNIDGNQATWTSPEFVATVNLPQPHRGLSKVRLADQDIAGLTIFGIHLENASSETAEPIEDVYNRGNDLIVTYEQTPQRTIRPQVYWRILDFPDVLGVELIISTQTSLLDSNPSVTLTSRLPTSSVRRLVDPATRTFVSVGLEPRDSDVSINADSDTPLMLFRLQDSQWSYVELLDPADFQGACLHSNPDGSFVEVQHQLFSERLEKGVIRRGRAWGLFVPQVDDEILACSAFNQLVAEAPPLTT